MDLVNVYPVTTKLSVVSSDETRLGTIIVKASFAIGSDGRVRVERDAPAAVLTDDEIGELGIEPREDTAHQLPIFEVIFLGAAYAPGGAQRSFQAGLAVGAQSRRITVFGRRVWQGEGREARIVEQEPATRVPLGPQAAFGGSVPLQVDAKSVMPIFYPFNDMGVGFDPGKIVAGLRQEMVFPPGFPRWPQPRRLPQLEDPDHPIRAWDDEPRPVFWSGLSLQSALGLEDALGIDIKRMIDPAAPMPTMPDADAVARQIAVRAHPAWRIGLPPAEAVVALRNLTRDARLDFRLPSITILVDYEVGERTGTLELWPQRLTIHAEERRFSLLYRRSFNFGAGRKQTRALRLRLERGWPRSIGREGARAA